jgi:SRSO17 transposase
LNRQEQAHNDAAREELQKLHTLIAPRFGRPEVRERAGRYLAGLLRPMDRRTGRQMARQIGEGRADGVQRLLNKARWDADAVRDDLRDYVVEYLGDRTGVLVLVETGFPKKGPYSAGVARQRNPISGRVEDCQVGLFLAYASPHGWAFIDRSLYLPEEWAEDEARRREAGVPEEMTFATEGELARKMLERAFDASVSAAWVTGGQTYGTDRELRRWLEARGDSYVLAEGYSSGLPRGAELLLPPVSDWVGFGSGGGANRPHKWARGKRRQERDAGWAEWLLMCHTAKEPAGYGYHGAYGPSNTPLSRLVRTVNTRWAVEENLDLTKGKVGLVQYEVRRWDAWHRHITLSLVAHAALQVTRARPKNEGDRSGRT